MLISGGGKLVELKAHNTTKASYFIKEYYPLSVSTNTISSSVSHAIIISILATDYERHSRNDSLQRTLNTCKHKEYFQFKIDNKQTMLMASAQSSVFDLAKSHSLTFINA